MNLMAPIIRLTSYYAGVLMVVVALFVFFPSVSEYLPLGGAVDVKPMVGDFVSSKATPVAWEPGQKAIELVLGLMGVIIFMLPVAWIYLGIRRRKGRNQSFVLTLLLLPMVVAGIVIIVENSLALAFTNPELSKSYGMGM